MNNTLRPQTKKGAFRIGDTAPQRVIEFQFNPETLTRTTSPAGGGDEQRAGLRFSGPAKTTMSFDIELDANVGLAQTLADTQKYGVAPALAALEALLGPSVAALKASDDAAKAGGVDLIPPAPPIVYLEWGPRFFVPVALTEFTVTEQEFNEDLYPTRVQAKIGLRVLTYEDLGTSSLPGQQYLKHLQATEDLAKKYPTKNDRTTGQ